jgi:hypothetical protein
MAYLRVILHENILDRQRRLSKRKVKSAMRDAVSGAIKRSNLLCLQER